MSHCTTFSMSFQDKRTLFRALRTLGYQPENVVWTEYKNMFSKELMIGGTVLGKLLTGFKDGIHVYFEETKDGLIPYFESHDLSPGLLRQRSASLLSEIREGYLQGTVEALRDSIVAAGGTVTVSEEKSGQVISYVLTIGTDARKLRISMNEQGTVEEAVEGVLGRSCAELTEGIEQKLSSPSEPERTWTHEYNATVEDQQIQILRLY
ncbi:DUF2997 domain-containing protein [Brevibacillus parabrevis]|uniref:DUF2997 domain-containing protein n=1 Tax=Brevibacillus parabrevis TaxID=54914 RepID=UPI00248FCD89|nr:DUF2997 domain-containing protein [Brevibacillus parabrevis]